MNLINKGGKKRQESHSSISSIHRSRVGSEWVGVSGREWEGVRGWVSGGRRLMRRVETGQVRGYCGLLPEGEEAISGYPASRRGKYPENFVPSICLALHFPALHTRNIPSRIEYENIFDRNYFNTADWYPFKKSLRDRPGDPAILPLFRTHSRLDWIQVNSFNLRCILAAGVMQRNWWLCASALKMSAPI